MKKKISYLILLCIMLLPITTVMADGFSSNEVISACGFGKYIPSKLPNFTSGLYNIVKLMVPVILIVMGMIDFTKAMMSSDEKKMKDSQKKFINRLIAGVVVFLIMAAVQFVFEQIDNSTSYKNGFVNCMNCILNGDMGACGGGTTDLRKHCSDYDYRNCNTRTDDYGNECMVDTSDTTDYKCKVKGTHCEDYLSSECPDKTSTGTYSCKVLEGKCVSSCSGLSKNSCEKLSYCKFERNDSWSGIDGKCVNR